MSDKSEQIQEAHRWAEHVIAIYGQMKPAALTGTEASKLNMARALLSLSEQLAAEQTKVKALQPYKDAYDEGHKWFAVTATFETAMPEDIYGWTDDIHAVPVRVCKLVEGGG